MTKQNENQEKALSMNEPVTLTAGDLLQLFSKLLENQNKSQELTAKTLADAFQESRKPYIDPKEEANRKAINESGRQAQLDRIKNQKARQRNCAHIQNLTGSGRKGDSAFCLMKLPTGEWIGVCPYCQKVITSLRPSHRKYFSGAALQPAESTQISLADPIKAQLARFTAEEQTQILIERKKNEEETQVLVVAED